MDAEIIAHENNNKKDDGIGECLRYDEEAKSDTTLRVQLRERFQIGSSIIDFLKSYNFLLHKVTSAEIPRGRSLGCPQCGYLMEPEYSRLWPDSDDCDTTSSESDSSSCSSSSSAPIGPCKRRVKKRPAPPAKKLQYSDVLKKNINSEETSF